MDGDDRFQADIRIAAENDFFVAGVGDGFEKIDMGLGLLALG